jgi:hypothetical protein
MTTRPARRSAPRAANHSLRGTSDAGSASLELVILFPALLLVVFVIIQYGLWFYARSLALAAAQEGVTVARSYGAHPGAGQDRAHSFLEVHGADTLVDVHVTVTAPTPGHVIVQVSGRSLSVIPGVAGPTITQSAQGPIERFTTAGAP